jgi:glycogen synthase
VLRVSVVICTYGRAAALKRTLLALEYLTHKDFEVVVVAAHRPTIRNSSFGNTTTGSNRWTSTLARNIGIANSAGEIVTFLDDDGIPEPDWLDMLLSGYDDPRVAGVGGFIRNPTGVQFQSRVVVCDRFGDSQDYKNLAAADVWHEPGCDRYLSLTGCNSSFRRTALLEIGGFDEEYAHFLDETDACLRLVDAGYDLTVVGSAQVHHKYLMSHLRDDRKVPRSLFPTCRSKAYFCAKFMSDVDAGAVVRRLKHYELDLRRDLKWLREASLIGGEKHDQLLAEISSGIKEGLQDARTYPPGRHTLSNYRPATRPKFLPFEVKKPADRRLKLCFVSQEYKPGPVGGIGAWTAMAAEGLAARGHQVTVLAAAGSDPSTVDFQNGVWVHRVATHHDKSRKSPKLPDLPASVIDRCYAVYDETQRVFSGQGIDVLSFPIWDLEGLACTSSHNYAVAISLHTTYGLALAHKPHWQNDRRYRTQFVDKMISAERELLNSGIPLLANSRAIARDIAQQYGALGEKWITRIPHGVSDLPTQRRQSDPGEDIRVLFVGRFESRKGIDLLLKVIPRLLIEFPQVRFSLVGKHDIDDGGRCHRDAFLGEYFDRTWMDRVEFCGELDDAELLDAYQTADVFVAPSRYESFGLIFIEAAQFALPIVAPNIGGVPEIVQNEVNGLLFEAGNPDHLESALRRILQDGLLRLTLGTAARQTFLREYTLDKMVDRLEAFYASLAGEWLDRRHIDPDQSPSH